MSIVSITVTSIYDQVKLQLKGVPSGVTPFSTVDGSVANSVYYMFSNSPFGTGLLTGEVLGNDRISINGQSGTYYTVTVIDIRGQLVLYEADFEIIGNTFDLDAAYPLSSAPIPNVNPIPEPPAYVNKTYVDTGDANSLTAAKAFTNAHHDAIANATDVVLTNPVTTQVLTFNGTVWVNAAGGGSTFTGGNLSSDLGIPTPLSVAFGDDGTADSNWRVGRNLNLYTTSHVTSNQLQIALANSALEGLTIGVLGNTSIFEIEASTHASWFMGKLTVVGDGAGSNIQEWIRNSDHTVIGGVTTDGTMFSSNFQTEILTVIGNTFIQDGPIIDSNSSPGTLGQVLTATGNNIAWNTSLISKTTAITADQLTNMFSTPIQIVPEAPAGFFNMPVDIYFSIFPGANIYGSINQLMEISYGTFVPGDHPDLDGRITAALIPTISVFDRFKLNDGLHMSSIDSQPINLAFTSQNLTLGVATSITLLDGGTGYAPGDTGGIQDSEGAENPGQEATYIVNTVDGGGAILTYTITSFGAPGLPGYQAGQVYPDDSNQASGSGSGSTWTVDSIAQGNGTAQVFVSYFVLPTTYIGRG